MLVELFLEKLEQLGVNHYMGVPDSQLKALCDLLYTRHGIGGRHIIAANEGAAIGLAAGHFIATGKPALVYMQNSGIGNIINPLASLMNEKVYHMPCVLVIGWRGEPGVADEPQHIFQGEITLPLLEMLHIQYFIISEKTSSNEMDNYVRESKSYMDKNGIVAFVVEKNAIKTENTIVYRNDNLLLREDALRYMVKSANDNDVFVSTTGKASRELFEIRETLGQGHDRDFLTVGSMGHASMIAAGIAMEKKDTKVWLIDGDGAAIMHLGSLALLPTLHCDRFVHVIINNEAHETVGGMPVADGSINFCKIAEAVGYRKCFRVYSLKQLRQALVETDGIDELVMIEIMVSIGSRDNLGRPTKTPIENKTALMNFLKGE